MTCTATYTVTQADINAGEVLNTATVRGHNLPGHTVTSNSGATVPTTSDATLTLAKTLVGASGSTATWNITVMNTGGTPYPGPFTVTDPLPAGLAFESVSGAGWTCSGTSTVSCTHGADLDAGTPSVITLKTTITGTGDITNTASIDVEGKVLSASAAYKPSGGFAFTGADAQRLGFLGLLGVVGGWFIVIAARKRNDDDDGLITDGT